MLFPVALLFLLLLLSTPSTRGNRYVRRAAEDVPEDSPPLVPGELPPGFGLDDQEDPENDPDRQDQSIRNGFAIPPLPWFAVFQSRTLCGASLIHGDILITAAHCVDDNGLPGKVRVGSNDYHSGGIVTNVLDGVIHPGWTWKRASDPDLAVLLLQDFLPFETAILNTDPDVPVASHPSLFAMGFGLTNDKTTSRTLLGATIPYLDNCSYRSYSYNRTRHLCADSINVATCGGDSGSPITLGSNSRLQVGINSYSNGKCSTQTLDVYTRVSFFYKWIRQQVCDMSKDPPPYCFTDPPTNEPTTSPTTSPTFSPTESPAPSSVPSLNPTSTPSASPTAMPTLEPTLEPTEAVTMGTTESGAPTAMTTEAVSSAPTET